MSDTLDPRDLRVGDAERDHVTGLLQRAVGRGMLDIDEFTARTDAALAATTRGQLNAVLVDLPGMEATPERMELVAGCSAAVKRDGTWTVPRELVVRARWNTAELDLTRARFPYREVRVRVDAMGAPVTLRLPAGAGVVLDDVSTPWGGAVDDKRRDRFVHGSPQVVISGTMRLAPLVIMGPE
ncbi:MAG TPA: DUF1707 domain-containing protein [Pseudonocardiaceae bacterium]